MFEVKVLFSSAWGTVHNQKHDVTQRMKQKQSCKQFEQRVKIRPCTMVAKQFKFALSAGYQHLFNLHEFCW